MRRILLAALLFLLLGPVPWSAQRRVQMIESDLAKAVPLSAPRAAAGALRYVRGWRLESRDSRFGGFSALAEVAPRQFLAVADNGRWVRIDLRGDNPRLDLGGLPDMGDERRSKGLRDVEAMATDPYGDRVWLALEGDHQLWRLDKGLGRIAARRRLPSENWGANRGAEAMARLPDGRFIIFAESRTGGGATEALLYAGDPVEGGMPLRFRYDAEGKGAVADAAALPDGRILLVHRKLGWNPVFTTIVAVADPAAIRADGILRSRAVGTVPAAIADNYEGAAVTEASGRTYLWLVSDDNFQRWQRSLLVQFELVGLSSGQQKGGAVSGPP